MVAELWEKYANTKFSYYVCDITNSSEAKAMFKSFGPLIFWSTVLVSETNPRLLKQSTSTPDGKVSRSTYSGPL
jgi:hypothetical protein